MERRARQAQLPLATDALKTALASVYLRDDAEIEAVDNWVVLRRGKLAGAGEWSHQYGSPDNACFSNDERVKGSLGVLWYGDPGPNKTINRHEAAAAPLSTNGRFFSQGIDSVRAYDAYNGQFLWEYKNPGAIRTGVFNNNETSNLAANDDSLFVVVGDTCTQLDAATGRIKARAQDAAFQRRHPARLGLCGPSGRHSVRHEHDSQRALRRHAPPRADREERHRRDFCRRC